MPKKRETRGTGITRKEYAFWAGPVSREDLEAIHSRVPDSEFFLAHFQQITERCRQIIGENEFDPSLPVVPPGVDVDSELGYAIRILGLLWDLNGLIGDGAESPRIAGVAYRLGTLIVEMQTKFEYENDIFRAVKVVESARRGHAEVFGTPAERQARWAELQRMCNDVAKRHPDFSWNRVMEIVAHRSGVSKSTIKRRCRRPPKSE